MNKIIKQCSVLLDDIRVKVPLIHNITNYVTVNDCANVILAIGASPIMADDIDEVEEIVSISQSLVLNIGTLNKKSIASMMAAGKKANELHIPVLLDPVGAGASSLRNQTVKELLSQVKISVLRGNLSEVAFVAGYNVSTKGVDAAQEDQNQDAESIAKAVAKQLSCVVGITGEIDTISDGIRVVQIQNGNKVLSKVTGTGCMTSALVGSLCGITSDYFAAATAGIACMGISGESALEKAGTDNMGSFHIEIINALSKLNSTYFEERVKINEN